MMKALTKTEFNFPGQKSVYHGKVRDVYNINGEKLVMVATDRISAFDVVLPEGIPYKGQMLNQIPRRNNRHLSELETCYPGPNGYGRCALRRFPGGNDCTRLPLWKCMARLQKWRTRNMRCETSGRNA